MKNLFGPCGTCRREAQRRDHLLAFAAPMWLTVSVNRCAPSPETVARNIETASHFLAGWPGVRRVWLFGSVAKGKTPDWRSDIDFAVEGIPPVDIFALWSELDARLTMPVDVVRLEDAQALLRSEILKGKLLWEEGQPKPEAIA